MTVDCQNGSRRKSNSAKMTVEGCTSTPIHRPGVLADQYTRTHTQQPTPHPGTRVRRLWGFFIRKFSRTRPATGFFYWRIFPVRETDLGFFSGKKD